MKRAARWMLLLAGLALLAGCTDAASLIEDQTEDMNKLADAIEAGKPPEEYQELAERVRQRGAKIDELTEEEMAELEEEYGPAYVEANIRLIEAGQSRQASAGATEPE
jgi:hypothetical protein